MVVMCNEIRLILKMKVEMSFNLSN